MTWEDATRISSRSSVSLGNFGRFIDADPLADASGGVDFNNTFSTQNPFLFTVYGSASIRSNREDPV